MLLLSGHCRGLVQIRCGERIRRQLQKRQTSVPSLLWKQEQHSSSNRMSTRVRTNAPVETGTVL